MSEWKTIDTAPKSGKSVLLYTVWKETPDYPCPSFSEIQMGYWLPHEGWVLEKIGTPTHWQELPKPPEISA